MLTRFYFWLFTDSSCVFGGSELCSTAVIPGIYLEGGGICTGHIGCIDRPMPKLQGLQIIQIFFVVLQLYPILAAAMQQKISALRRLSLRAASMS